MRHLKSEPGSTLIELMVAVLILSVLMAIAVPTFLALTSSAQSTGAEANLSTAATDESAYYLHQGAYRTPASSPSMTTADGGLNWQPACAVGQACITDTGGVKDGYVETVTDGSFRTLVVGAVGTPGTEYWELLSQNPASPGVEHEVTTSATAPLVSAFQTSPVYTTWKQAGG